MSPRQMMWLWEASIFGPAALMGWAIADGWPILALVLGASVLFSTHVLVEYVDGAVRRAEGWDRSGD